MAQAHRFTPGDTVSVDSWGLSGFPLIVSRCERDGHYSLRFAHTGNALPGYYHDALVRAG